MTRSTQAIGIFGGTFDPVHYGHLRAALEAMERLQLQDFRLLPAGTPPHRASTFASADHRLAMLKLALSRYPELQVDDREVRREGSSYMVDTLGEIRRGMTGINCLTWRTWSSCAGRNRNTFTPEPSSSRFSLAW
jgi:nicotinate-nucleotide adenylyltransferase